MLGPLVLIPMSWHRRATWEWTKVNNKGAMVAPAPACVRWISCTPGTCLNLESMSNTPVEELTGRRVTFNDTYSVSRVFSCVGYNTNANAFVLFHNNVTDEGPVTLFAREISYKLLRANLDHDRNEIYITAVMSGETLFAVPYAEHERSTWALLTEVVNKMSRLPANRVVLFPEHVIEPEAMNDWKERPQLRSQVRSLLQPLSEGPQRSKKRGAADSSSSSSKAKTK